jgi:DNA oxidative demethylase
MSQTTLDGFSLLRGFALPQSEALLAEVARIASLAPFRNMTTPGGQVMSAAMTNVGLGWVTDPHGYRYSAVDPESGLSWPVVPEVFLDLASRAAEAGGFPGYVPDGCLINRYEPGARISLHQDLDDGDRTAPIVSVSLGLPSVFQFGGLKRNDPLVDFELVHGDIAVWGGPARLAYHGVLPLETGSHPVTGGVRYNLTFRKAR